MKAQICPACKKDAKEKHGFIPMACCENGSCNLFEKWFTIAFWNSIRVAPNGENVVSAFIGHEEHGITEHQDWMNPSWPEGGEDNG